MAVVRGDIAVKPHVQACVNAMERALGITNFGTYPGHSPPEGPAQAVDIFTPDSAAGWALQDRICAWVIANAEKYGIRYVIRREHIWNIERAAEGWRRQTRYNNRTADHYDHVHITFYAKVDVIIDIPTDPDTPPVIVTPEGVFEMETITYMWAGEDWIFCRLSKVHGRLPFPDVLEAMKSGESIKNYGPQSSNFHAGLTAWANAAGFAEIYSDDRDN